MSNQQYPVDTKEVLSPREFREQFFGNRIQEIQRALSLGLSALDAQEAHDLRTYDEQMSRHSYSQAREEEANPVLHVPGFSGLVAGGDGSSLEQHYPEEVIDDKSSILPGGPDADELRRYIGMIHGAEDV